MTSAQKYAAGQMIDAPRKANGIKAAAARLNTIGVNDGT